MLIVALCDASVSTADALDAQRIEMATTFVNRLVMDEFEKAVEPFDGVMATRRRSTELKQKWNGAIAQYRPFHQILGSRTKDVVDFHIVSVDVRFGDGKPDRKVVLTSDNRIAGVFFLPSGIQLQDAGSSRAYEAARTFR